MNLPRCLFSSPRAFPALALALAVALSGCKPKTNETSAPGTPNSAPNSAPATAARMNPPAPLISSFIKSKLKQAESMAQAAGIRLPPELQGFFEAAAANNWPSANRNFGQLDAKVRNQTGVPEVQILLWQVAQETFFGCQQFIDGTPKMMELLGSQILKAVPAGSVYFGGTDPGRYVVTAMSEAHAEGRPFFTLTQNQLADARYLRYLQIMYGDKIKIPAMDEARQNFEAYLKDAEQRLAANQLKADEEVRKLPDGRTQASGRGAIIAINAGLVRRIFDANPDRDFYIEPSFPLDWTYPHLIPAGPVLKINRQSLPSLPEDALRADADYWSAFTQQLIGDPIRADFPIAELCQWVEDVHLKKNPAAFKGNPDFLQDDHAKKAFAKLRGSIADVFRWRAEQAGDDAARKSATNAANLAFRQAFALCPYNVEVALTFYNYLARQQLTDDARLVGRTTLKFPPTDPESAQQLEALNFLKPK
jgi:hypothetical protein